MIRSIISTVLGVTFIYVVYTFLYTQVPAARPVMNDMKDAVFQTYNWAVGQWGGVVVGGALVLLIIGSFVLKR